MTKMITSSTVGKFGESKCTRLLKRNGYKILERNSKIGHLEADVIAINKTHILFVEVKTRRSDLKNPVRPGSAVNRDKKSNLIHFANSYTRSLPEKYKNRQIRIDVCEILVFQKGNRLKTDQINYIENAITR
ncbi:MAG: YraN family protein [Clostridia bacterium]|nr:YraN family protein [Clostridia bacterium]